MIALAIATSLAFSGPALRGPARAAVRMADAAAPAEPPAEPAAEAPPPPPPPPPKMSLAIPFLVENAKLAGLPGGVGFDPLGLSNGPLPIEWMIEAELKHGRVCMLAVVGMLVPEVVTLPGRDFSVVAAHDAGVASGAMSQIFLWTGLFETIALLATIQMLQGGSRKPGDFSFDPLNFSKGADAQRLAVSEVKNGRLAMLAFSGMITQAALSGNGFPFTYT